jgi:hypothetical protein
MDANSSSSSSITASQSIFPITRTVSAVETVDGMLMGATDIREAFAAGPPQGEQPGAAVSIEPLGKGDKNEDGVGLLLGRGL